MRITSKQYVHLQTMNKTPVMFQRNPHKNEGADAYSRYLVSVNFDRKNY